VSGDTTWRITNSLASAMPIRPAKMPPSCTGSPGFGLFPPLPLGETLTRG